MKTKKLSKYVTRYFSSVTGKAVTKAFAEENPDTTFSKKKLRKVKPAK
jgi:hypothetical protein